MKTFYLSCMIHPEANNAGKIRVIETQRAVCKPDIRELSGDLSDNTHRDNRYLSMG